MEKLRSPPADANSQTLPPHPAFTAAQGVGLQYAVLCPAIRSRARSVIRAANKAGHHLGQESFALISLSSATLLHHLLIPVAYQRDHITTEIFLPNLPGTCTCPVCCSSCSPTGQRTCPEVLFGEDHASPWSSGGPAARDEVFCTQSGSSAIWRQK